MDHQKRPSTGGEVASKKLKSKQPVLEQKPAAEKDIVLAFPAPFNAPAPYVSDSIKCNPFTYGMLTVEFYLCKECRGFLTNRTVMPEDDGTVYVTVKMCGACKELNGKIRACYKETMKKDWPSNNIVKKAQTSGGDTKPYVAPPIKLTPRELVRQIEKSEPRARRCLF
jgi:hypothetical protein